jgi:hypothetical protein
MMQLIITVMAIGLAALLAVGGVTYFSTDIGHRIAVQQALRSQHDAIVTAVSSYRTANNGFVHPDVARLEKYLPEGRLPRIPGGEESFSWSIEKNNATGQFLGLCLNRESGAIDRGVAQGVASFAQDRAARYPGSVIYGTRGGSGPCGMTQPPDGSPQVVAKDSPLDAEALRGNSNAVISFRGF